MSSLKKFHPDGSKTAGYCIALAETRNFKARAKLIGKYVPRFYKLANKRGLITAGEKSQITKYEKALRHADNLHPLRGAMAVALSDKWFEASPLTGSGNKRRHYRRPIRIPAIQMRGLGDSVTMTII